MIYNNNQVSLAELAAKVGVTEEALRSRSHNQEEVDARSMVVALLMARPMRQQDVAPLLGITQVAVSKLLARHRRMVQYHPPYRRRWNEINAAEKMMLNQTKKGIQYEKHNEKQFQVS